MTLHYVIQNDGARDLVLPPLDFDGHVYKMNAPC